MSDTKKFRYQHILSNVEDKAPTAAQLYEGEIAVNKFAGKEKLFIKNSGGNVISFSSDSQIDTKLSNSTSGYADSVNYNSTTHYVEFYHGTTAGTKVFEYDASPFLIDGMVESVTITSITSGQSEIQVLEITWNSAAGSQVTDIPLADIFDPSNYYTKDEYDDDMLVISTSLNDLEERKLDASAYTPTDLSDYYTKSETSGATEISTALASKSDTGHTHDDRYYTESEIDAKFGSAFTSSSVTEVLKENEFIISTSLNDLNSRKLDESAYTPVNLSNYYTKSETSGATEISTALGGKVSTAITISGGTGLSGGGTLTENRTINLAMPTTYSAETYTSTTITSSEPVVYALVRYTGTTSLANQVCPVSLADGQQCHVIYQSTNNNAYSAVISTNYSEPDGEEITLDIPAGGYAEINYLNIKGIIFARGV